MCATAHLSIREAAQNLKQFMEANIPSGTPVDITAKKVDELKRMIDNVLTLSFNTSVVDLDKARQAYEAVGWLCVTIEDQFLDSSFEDHLLAEWAKEALALAVAA